MSNYEQKLKDIKSDMLGLITSAEIEFNDFNKYMRVLDPCLTMHFDITTSVFLKCESEILLPIKKEPYDHLIQDAISWAMIEPYFFQNKVVKKPVLLEGYEQYALMDEAILLQHSNEKPVGILLIKATPAWQNYKESPEFVDFLQTITDVLYKVDKIASEKTNEEHYRKLFKITDLFHSTMDVDIILENMLITLEKQIPHLNVDLILSNDQDRELTLNVKLFDYAAERPSIIEAFVSGELTFEQAVDLKCRILNAPIKGRQAIYGILQISGPEGYVFSGKEKDFIRMLADACGNALENAKLHRQSNRLISDLQLINETSHRLNMKMDIDEMFVYLKSQLEKSFQPQEICFMFKEHDKLALKEGSSFFSSDASLIYTKYVQDRFETSKDPIFIADFSRQINKPIKYNSMMAIPILIEGKIHGYCVVLHQDSYFFPFDSFKLMQSLIHHSSLAMANTILQNQLQEMVDRDHLTKLYARSYLDKYVEQALDNYAKGMFFLIDIDNFKRVNDTYGHQIGDEVLVQISKQLKAMVGDKGICARWGGEELAVCIPNVSVAYAKQVAQKFVEVMPTVTKPQVTISAGLITWNTEEQPIFKSIFSQADDALYQAKNSGKNRFVVYGE